YRDGPVRNVGWSPYLLDGHSRWEVFELVGPESAEPEPPHLEDVWVRSLRPRRRLATPGQRREILEATAVRPGDIPFGVPLTATRASLHLPPGTGQCSLTTLVLPADQITFTVSSRQGAPEPDIRVHLDYSNLAGRTLPVKDHALVSRAERAT